jgi:hypothetical protein
MRTLSHWPGSRRYSGLSPSASNCRLHSAGGSRSRSTPMPRGRRPSTAALTRPGARKASEMVMLTCRTLHFSRMQISWTVVTRPETTSSSHWRPLAIALTRRARRSNDELQTPPVRRRVFHSSRASFRFPQRFHRAAIKFLCGVYKEAPEPGSHSYAAIRISLRSGILKRPSPWRRCVSSCDVLDHDDRFASGRLR